MTGEEMFLHLNNLLEEVLAEVGTLIASDSYDPELRADINLLFERMESIENLLKK